jgi:uncharacterized protein involved in exopolysaccharide biosynthesis
MTMPDADRPNSLWVLVETWRLIVFGALGAGVIALGIASLVPKTFTARTSFITPPQQGGLAGLASLGSLAPLANLAGGSRASPEQYAALLRSHVVQDHLIDKFKLIDVYDEKLRTDARKTLGENVRVNLAKREGIIEIEVDDRSPERAAQMANEHVEELRQLTSRLALTDAQQRRLFFEGQLVKTRDRMTQAQVALQASGFHPGALKTEPKAAAEVYAKLRAEAVTAEVRLQALRGSLVDSAPEVVQQQAALSALRAQLARAEQTNEPGDGPDYIGRYREFKYQESLFEQLSRQFELARLDEAREGALIQVVDVAVPPEKKSKPKRALIAVAATLATGFLLVMFVLLQQRIGQLAATPEGASMLARLKRSVGLS